MVHVAIRHLQDGGGRTRVGRHGRSGPKSAKGTWCAAAIAIGALWIVSFTAARGDSTGQRLVEGLRQRRLFSLVEAYCLDKLSQPNLSARERAEWTVERIRGLAERAVHAAPADRPARWRKAREPAEEFVRQYPGNPRILLVRFQDALTVLAQAELARQEADVAASGRQAEETVRETIRHAIRLLDELADQVAAEMVQARRGPSRRGELAEGELSSLQGNVRRQLARAYRNQALSYPRGSDDRVAALAQALRQLENALPQALSDDPLAWEIRLEQAVCRRLLGDRDAARQIAGALDQQGAPPGVRLRARAELARVELAAGDPQKALHVLGRPPEIRGWTEADFDFAQLETFVALWRKAQKESDAAVADSWRDRSVAMVRRIEQTHGPYWARRAELLLVGAAPERLGRGDLEVLARSADTLYLQGLLDQAVEAYEKAGRLAEEAGDPDRAFEFRYKAALIEGKRGASESMVRRLRSLALSMKSDSRAGQAHLLAAAQAAELARKDPRVLGLYEEILQENVAAWPQSPTADTARLWRGRLCESRGQWSESIASYGAVSPDSPHYEASVKAAARCWRRRLDDLKSAGRPCAEQAAEAVTLFESIAASRQAGGAAAARWAALAAARILLRHTPDGGAHAEKILREAMKGSAPAPDAWAPQADTLLAIALASQRRRRDEAESLVRRLGGGASPQPLLEALAGLSAAPAARNEPAASPWAELRLLAASLLTPRRDELDEADRRTMDRLHAEALTAAGRRAEALDAYAALAKQRPRDGSIQEAYAELLSQGDDPATRSKALEQWRRVARGSRPGGDRWYRAKYAIALLQWRQGDRRAAAQLIQYLQVTVGLDNTPLKSQFLDLLERCRP